MGLSTDGFNPYLVLAKTEDLSDLFVGQMSVKVNRTQDSQCFDGKKPRSTWE